MGLEVHMGVMRLSRLEEAEEEEEERKEKQNNSLLVSLLGSAVFNGGRSAVARRVRRSLVAPFSARNTKRRLSLQLG